MTSKSLPNFDEALVWDCFRDGDKKAFTEIYERFAKVLYNYAYKLTHDSQVAQDAVQELFVEIWEARERLSATDSIRFYLYRSLRRKIHRSYQTEWRADLSALQDHEVPDTLLWPSIEDMTITAESLEANIKWLKSQLEQLSAREYEALQLRFYDGLDYDQIADILQINDQSARNLITRAIQRLRRNIPDSLLHVLLYSLFQSYQ
ncbi:RNA polymerase sigma factor [Runella slithyformis]|uniref:RNA polymerase, sigma-24 subunit, ECF subfamily n=1 Tax=Runella slithyformis (strain ATCC 29530 / DSM 19594 / LMG 11500 / NCIMB 11436 / LSU 4) TaxID=761193 RepID=A0A7U4E6C7_RUNSL|nr:sigma-70 family RNA polymerase sigma factor [Runella slithyformis]AEI49064.1 RNA polymerase, sigma-24 subunit, ECF subfamily [Runella slithyformis DSM 19594]